MTSRIFRDTLTLFNFAGIENGKAVYVKSVLRGARVSIKHSRDLSDERETCELRAHISACRPRCDGGKVYVSPEKWLAASDKSGMFTLGECGCVVCPGEVDASEPYGAVERYTVCSVVAHLGGSRRLRHFEIAAK